MSAILRCRALRLLQPGFDNGDDKDDGDGDDDEDDNVCRRKMSGAKDIE